MATRSFPVPTHFNMLAIFNLENGKQDHKLELTDLDASWIMHIK